MKITLPKETKTTRTINTMSLAGVSLLWGQMLGYISPWFSPLTILILIVAYGSELRPGETD